MAEMKRNRSWITDQVSRVYEYLTECVKFVREIPCAWITRILTSGSSASGRVAMPFEFFRCQGV